MSTHASMKKGLMGVVYVVLYIDDNLMIRDVVVIEDATSALKNNWPVGRAAELFVLQHKILQ